MKNLILSIAVTSLFLTKVSAEWIIFGNWLFDATCSGEAGLYVAMEVNECMVFNFGEENASAQRTDGTGYEYFEEGDCDGTASETYSTVSMEECFPVGENSYYLPLVTGLSAPVNEQYPYALGQYAMSSDCTLGDLLTDIMVAPAENIEVEEMRAAQIEWNTCFVDDLGTQYHWINENWATANNIFGGAQEEEDVVVVEEEEEEEEDASQAEEEDVGQAQEEEEEEEEDVQQVEEEDSEDYSYFSEWSDDVSYEDYNTTGNSSNITSFESQDFSLGLMAEGDSGGPSVGAIAGMAVGCVGLLGGAAIAGFMAPASGGGGTGASAGSTAATAGKVGHRQMNLQNQPRNQMIQQQNMNQSQPKKKLRTKKIKSKSQRSLSQRSVKTSKTGSTNITKD